jgi:predicted PurR-regulated permease PerM
MPISSRIRAQIAYHQTMALKKPSLHFGTKSPAAAESLGQSGMPLDRAHPFYFGFLAAAGGVISITLLKALASASQVFVLIVISLFLAAGLNPAVEFFRRRGLARKYAVLVVIGCVVAFVGLFAAVVIPPVIKQVDLLVRNAPDLISNLKNNPTLAKLNTHYGIIDSIQKKVASSIHNGQFVITAFGGVIGVGKAVLSGAIATLTIMVLTLYFLASLPAVTSTAYRFVPLSRRDRVSRITDATVRRIGSFVSGQATVAFIAAVFALTLALVLRIPYPQAVALLVFICGLIPLVGHILGCTAFTLVALTKSPTSAIVVLCLYIAYVQLENYYIMPRIMRRSLSIPGIVTIISALIGVSLLGIVGGILAVPIAAAVLLILDEVVFPKAEVS